MRNYRKLTTKLLFWVAAPFAALGQNSTWVATPTSTSSESDWQEATNWDTNISPNSASAVAIIHQAESDQSVRPVIATGAISVHELRYVFSNPAGSIVLGPRVGGTDGTPSTATLTLSSGLISGTFPTDQGNFRASLEIGPGGSLELRGQSSANLGSSGRLIVTMRGQESAMAAVTVSDESSLTRADFSLVGHARMTLSHQATLGDSTVLLDGDSALTLSNEAAIARTSLTLAGDSRATVAGSTRIGASTIELRDRAEFTVSEQAALSDGTTITTHSESAHVILDPATDAGDFSGLSLKADTGGILEVRANASTPVVLKSVSGPMGIWLNDRTLSFTGGTSNLSGRIVGPGKIQVVGGASISVSNPDNSFTGGMDIIAGEVALAGGRIPTTTVSAAARLTGKGVVDGNLTNAGTIAVGGAAAAGQITVAGDYLQSTDATLAIKIGPAGAGDRLSIGGRATLNGGTVKFSTLNGTAPVGSSVTEFLGSSKLSGRFGHVEATFGAALLGQVIYSGTSASLEISQLPFADFSVSPAGAALGRHLDDTLDTATGAYRSFVSQLNAIPSADLLEARIERLTPDRYGVIAEQGFFSALSDFEAIERRDDPFAATRVTTFFEGNQRRSRFDSEPGMAAAEGRADGGTAGVTWRSGAVSATVALALDETTIDLDAEGSTADSDRRAPMVQVRYGTAGWFLRAGAAYSREDYRLARRVGPGALATGSTSGHRADLSLQAGTTIPVGSWTVVPTGAIIGSRWSADPFTEAGAESGNMTVDLGSVSSVRSRAGIQVFRTLGGGVRPRFALHWLHEFDTDRRFTARFVGASQDYQVPGRAAEDDLVQASVGLSIPVASRGQLQLAAGGTWGRKSEIKSDASVGLSWSF